MSQFAPVHGVSRLKETDAAVGSFALGLTGSEAGQEEPPVPAAVLRLGIAYGPTTAQTEVEVGITGVHPGEQCEGRPCGLHARPSPHLLADRPMRLRFEFTGRGTGTLPCVVERACPRVPERWHADPDSLGWLATTLDPVRYAIVRAEGASHACGCVPCLELDLLLQGLPTPPPAPPITSIRTLNSLYELDWAHGRARRVFGVNPPTGYFTPDGDWKQFNVITQPRVGESWLLHNMRGGSCVSSVVTEIHASG